MTTKDQSCGQCRYFKFTEKSMQVGDCKAPLPEAVSAWWLRKRLMFQEWGTECPAFRKRINRRKKATVSQIRPQVGP
jgi:hypothetical protein